MKVQIELYSDSYGNRVAMYFPYHHQAKNQLKYEMKFPTLKWEPGRKAWSVVHRTDAIYCAYEILTTFGFNCSDLYALIKEEVIQW